MLGKPKGYGFCEYRDAETALSAMRNLNNYDFNGRQLRVDFAETDKGGATGGTTRTQTVFSVTSSECLISCSDETTNIYNTQYSKFC